jgi:hypothetical protein
MADQGQQPEWKGLINKLVNLNGKQADIKAVATNAAATINKQATSLTLVGQALDAILNKLKATPSSSQIKAALEKANGDQVQAIETLITAQNDALTPDLDLLQANVKVVQDKTQSITDAQTPPAVGGKRRRRTRSKGKKYHKRTKRGGYPYGNGKGKGKKSPKKNKK